MRAEGGDGSLTITEHELRAISYKASLLLFQNGGGKGQKPKPPSSPARHTDRKKQEKRLKANAERSMRQHQRKIGALAS